MTIFQPSGSSYLRAAFATVSLLAMTGSGFAAPDVVASIKPVHSLVSAVMEGVGEPELIVTGAASPHSFALKPSQAQALDKADLIFWIGPELEAFLTKPIETIGTKANVVTLADLPGVEKLKFRQDGAFEAHEHHHGEGAEDEHEHEADHAEAGHESDHADAAHDHDKDHDHDEDHDHHDGEIDPHMWLDPVNAKVFVEAIGEALAKADPDNAERYASNVRDTDKRLDALMAEVDGIISPARGKHFIVFHDAYHYFENRFGIEASGSITVNPENKPSAERLTEIRHKVSELNTACAFSEPQFNAQLVSVAIEGSKAQTAVLDPLGANLEDGPELYFKLIRNLATSMRDCLTAGE